MIERTLDFETASACDLKKAGSWRYAEDPSTEILCLSYEGLNGQMKRWTPRTDGPELPLELEMMALDPEVIFCAHNASFEKAIWRLIMVPVYGAPNIPNKRWHDTLAVCAAKGLPLDLDMAAIVLRLPTNKDMEGNRLTLSLSKPDKKTGMFPPRTPEVLERVGLYCDDDVRAQRGLHDRIGWLSAAERQVWLLDQRINERGIRLDMDYVTACEKIVAEASGPLAKEFERLTGGLGTGQVQKIQGWLKENKVFLPNLTKETLKEVLGHDIDTQDDDDSQWAEDETEEYPIPPDVRRALEIRQLIGSASVKKLGRMRQCVGNDGRAHYLLQYNGAGPGRWAGRIIQPHNFPRPTLKDDNGDGIPVDVMVAALMTGDPAHVEAVLGAPVEAVVSGLRHAIVADAKRRFVSGDFATIEARVVLALAGEASKLELLREGKDIYIDMAQQIYKRPIDKKKDPEERQTGKNSVLGLGFQMGWRKFRSRYCKAQPEEFAQGVVKTYREEWAPGVPHVWYGLEEAACKAVWDGTPQEAYGVLYQREDLWLTARLPSGRKLWYFNPQPVRKAMPWDDTDIRPAWTYQARKMGQWKTIDAFGGLLTENTVQALARDLLVDAMFKLEKENFPLVLTVHDEALAEPLEKDVDELAFKQIMTSGTDWSRELQIPIAVETWTGERYRK